MAGGKFRPLEMKRAMTKQSKPRCPVCGREATPIVFGLHVDDDFERTGIIFGGCIVEETNADLVCSNSDLPRKELHIDAF